MPKFFDDWRAQCEYYTDSHEEWADTVKKFVNKEIAPHIDQWEDDELLPLELFKKAGDVGILGLGFPEEYGGISEGIDHFHNNVTGFELASVGAGGLQAGLLVFTVGVGAILAIGSEALKKRVVPPVLAGEKLLSLAVTEPSGGSDVAALKTTAVKKGNKYIVNGSKTFITGGTRADFYVTAVRTGGPGPSGISLLLLEKGMKGLEHTKLRKMGWHCSDTATLYFDNVEVPEENLIGPEGGAFIGMMKNFNGERLGIASTSSAFSMVCLEEALEWAKIRETFGKPLVQHQVIRQKLAVMTQKIYSTQVWADRCTMALQQGKAHGGEIALLKVHATQALEYCAREACQILGGASYVRGSKVERIYREVRANAIPGGSEEIMLDLAAKQFGYLS